MGQTTVTGTILGVDNAPQVGVFVVFRLKSVGTDSGATSTIDADSISSPATDSNGQFTQVLWDNGDSGVESVIEILMPSGQRIDVIIPAGDAAITLNDLIENYQADESDPQLPTNQDSFLQVPNNLSDVASPSIARANIGAVAAADTLLVANDLSDLNDPATARVNIGLELGVDVATNAQGTLADSATQPLDNLTTLGSGAEVSGRIASSNGSGGVVWTTASTGSGDMLSTNNLNDVANVPTSRTNLGLAIGSDVQAHAANLDATTGTFLTQDQTKLDGIQALADVTDAAAVIAAGAYTVGGTDVAVLDGGTGASTESGARTSLGLEIGVDVQAFDSTILVDADIGSTVQAQDSDLDTISGLSPSQYDVMEHTGSVWAVKDGQISPQRFPIRSAADFPSTLVDGTQYEIYGQVAMGAVSPILPVAPARVTICGIGPSASLTSAENNYTMFTNITNSGSVKFMNILLTASGTSSQVGNLTNDGTGSFVMSLTSLAGCTKAFTLSGYNFFQVKDSQDISCTNVFELDGNMAAGQVETYGSFNLASGGTVFSAGGGLSISSRFLISCVVDIQAGATLCDFTDSHLVQDAGLEVLLSQLDGAGSFFSGITEANTKSRWRDNNWPSTATENNTYIGSRWELTTPAATVITSSGVYVKVAGTTTYGDEQWFSNTTNNAFVYDSTRVSKVIIAGSLNISAVSGGASKDLLATIRHWDDSASAYVDLPGTPRGTATSAGDIRNVSILTEADLDVNDRIELWIQNDTDTIDLTLEAGSTLVVTERAN